VGAAESSGTRCFFLVDWQLPLFEIQCRKFQQNENCVGELFNTFLNVALNDKIQMDILFLYVIVTRGFGQ
jgi:hypothetical protein